MLAFMGFATLGVVVVGCPQDPVDRKRDQIRRIVQSGQAPIEFYGKVLDQDGQPVPGAEVQVSLQVYDALAEQDLFVGVQELKLSTDDSGGFDVRGARGKDLIISGILKTGFVWENDHRIFRYSGGPPAELFKPDPKAPVSLAVRRKNPPALVIPNEIAGQIDYERMYHLDLIGELGRPWPADQRLPLGYPNLVADLGIFAKRIEYDSSCELDLQALGPGGGMALNEGLLYTAPEDGYAPILTLKFRPGPDKGKFLYVRSRDGRHYARLEFDAEPWINGVVLKISAWVNPNGDRNLDYDEDLFVKYLLDRSDLKSGPGEDKK